MGGGGNGLLWDLLCTFILILFSGLALWEFGWTVVFNMAFQREKVLCKEIDLGIPKGGWGGKSFVYAIMALDDYLPCKGLYSKFLYY